jgi:hypothetical protein
MDKIVQTFFTFRAVVRDPELSKLLIEKNMAWKVIEIDHSTGVRRTSSPVTYDAALVALNIMRSRQKNSSSTQVYLARG